MRDSASFWDETARPGDLVWCKINGTRHSLGIVIDIEGYDYWNYQESFSKWKYKIWINGQILIFQSWKISKV